MAAALLPDPLGDLVEPFLPTPSRRSRGGRPRSLRKTLTRRTGWRPVEAPHSGLENTAASGSNDTRLCNHLAA